MEGDLTQKFPANNVRTPFMGKDIKHLLEISKIYINIDLSRLDCCRNFGLETNLGRINKNLLSPEFIKIDF